MTTICKDCHIQISPAEGKICRGKAIDARVAGIIFKPVEHLPEQGSFYGRELETNNGPNIPTNILRGTK